MSSLCQIFGWTEESRAVGSHAVSGTQCTSDESAETAMETGPQAISRVFMALHPSVAIEGCRGTAIYTPEREHRGNPGWLHGGLAATLLDHVSARVAGAALGGPVVTGKLEVRYVRPVSLGEGPYSLTASYEPPKSGRPVRYLVRIDAMISDDQGCLVEASALFVPRPDAQSLDCG